MKEWQKNKIDDLSDILYSNSMNFLLKKSDEYLLCDLISIILSSHINSLSNLLKDICENTPAKKDILYLLRNISNSITSTNSQKGEDMKIELCCPNNCKSGRITKPGSLNYTVCEYCKGALEREYH